MDANRISSTKLPFVILTVVAVILLQGILIADYAFGAMLKAIWYEQFANGKILHRVYTGWPVIDELLAMSVSFWDVVAANKPTLRSESIMLCASLQTFAVWAAIERLRRGEKHLILRWAPVYVFCWQYFGTAIFVPFYCYVELNRHFNPLQGGDPSIPYYQAKALIPAAIIGVIHPFRMVYFPPSGMTLSQHQAFIATYQLGPFVCYAAVAALANYFSSDGKATTTFAVNADAPWIKATYAIFGTFSGIVHLAVVGCAWRSDDPCVSLNALFVPRVGKLWLPDAADALYVEESLFFLQWDFILVVLACMIYVAGILETMRGSRGTKQPATKNALVAVCCGILSVLFSPGAVVSAVLYAREDFLRQQFAGKERERILVRAGKPAKN
ncbi:hypothetical protein G7046_g1837 [Stylonectria norvegica]|nr:hypothetical protein G7046_g1837 [Stylonectria norvegica]